MKSLQHLSLKPKEGLTLILTVGNPMRRDDGVGPYIASKLSFVPNRTVMEGGMHPENQLDDITRLNPSRILILDAADFGGSPGELRLIETESIPETSLSTHAISLKVIAKILNDDTGAEIVFIGIQPQNVSFGEGLSPRVRHAADKLIQWLKKL